MVEINLKWSKKIAEKFLRDMLFERGGKKLLLFGFPIVFGVLALVFVFVAVAFFRTENMPMFFVTLGAALIVILSAFGFPLMVKFSAMRFTKQLDKQEVDTVFRFTPQNILISLQKKGDANPQFGEMKWENIKNIKVFDDFAYFTPTAPSSENGGPANEETPFLLDYEFITKGDKNTLITILKDHAMRKLNS